VASYAEGQKNVLRDYAFKETPMINMNLEKYVADSSFIFGFRGEDYSTFYRWDWMQNETMQFDLSGIWSNSVDVIVHLNEGKILISSPYGVVVLDEHLKELHRFILPASGDLGTSDFVCEDYMENIFRVVKGKGVYLLPNQKKEVKHFDIGGNRDNAISCMTMLDGRLLVGCVDGSLYEFVDNQLVMRLLPSTVIHKPVKSILAKDGQIWIVREHDVSIVTKEFEVVPQDMHVTYSYNARMKEYLKGCSKEDVQRYEKNHWIIWGATKEACYHAKLGWLSIANGFHPIVVKEGALGSFVAEYDLGRQYATVISDDGKVWFGGMTGLSYLDGDSIVDVSDNHLLYGKSISNLVLDLNQNLWVGTDGFGVYGYREGQLPIVVKGCEYDIVLDMVMSSAGDLWVSTNHGIKQIIMDAPDAARVFKTYSQLDGLRSEASAKIWVVDSLLYAGSELGLDVVPIYSSRGASPPKLYFNQVKAAGQLKSPSALHNLSFDENDLSISYTGVSLANKNALTYRYFVSGYTKDTLATHENKIELSQLPFGKYVLTIFAEDFAGNRSDTKELTFEIAKPWYNTWWAYLLALILVGLVIYWIVRRQLRKMRQKESVKKRVAELELQALQSQLNPHFIFNALGAIQQYQYGDNAEDAEEYFTGFARLMRLYLESSRQALMPLQDELELIQLYIDLEKLRFEDKFKVEIIVDDSLEAEYVRVPSMVLQPFVENAINHGLFHKDGVGHLLIRVQSLEEDWIQIVIRDDGVGRKRVQELAKQSFKKHKSRAMQIIEERLRIMNKIGEADIKIEIIDLFDEWGEASGTEVRIVLPLID